MAHLENTDQIVRHSPPPPPKSHEDYQRQMHTRLRRRIMYGNHEEDVKDRTRRQIGKTRFEAWGQDVDLSSNVPETVYTQKAVQYDQTPSIRNDAGEAEALIGNDGLMSRAGIWQMMPRVQRDAFGLRVMLVRVNVADAELTYRPVFPDLCTAEVFSDQPDVPIVLSEARLYTIPGTEEREWCFDILDLTEQSYRVIRASDGEDRSSVYLATDDNPEGDFTGARYPYRLDDGAPFLPYAIYRPVKSGQMWDARTESRVFDGGLQAMVYQTQFAHIMRTASWAQRYAIGAEPSGTGTEDENQDGRGRRGVITDPAVLLIFEALADFEGQPTVGTFPVSCSPQEFQDAIANYERHVAAAAGLEPSDVMRMSGDPRSGYALAISREGQRLQQRKHEEMFRRGDQELLTISAAIANRAGLGPFPETGWRLEYRALPKTPEEAKKEAEVLNAEVAAGMMDVVEAYRRRHPGITDDQAQLDLERIRTINAQTTAEPIIGATVAEPIIGATVADAETDASVDLDAVDKAQDTALNGAQVQAAQGIVQEVAAGRLPRATGVEMLIAFFNLDPKVATKIMGTVGAGFVPTDDD